MCLRLRKRPPANMPDINSGKPWSEMDLADLDSARMAEDRPPPPWLMRQESASADSGEESSPSAETRPPAPPSLSPESGPPDSPSLMRRRIELFGPSILAIVGLVMWWWFFG